MVTPVVYPLTQSMVVTGVRQESRGSLDYSSLEATMPFRKKPHSTNPFGWLRRAIESTADMHDVFSDSRPSTR